MALPEGFPVSALYGVAQQNPEEMEEVEAMMRRLRAAASEASAGRGAETTPFAGLTVHGGQKLAEMPEPVTSDAAPPRRRTAPPSAEAPSTSGWSPRMEPTAPLEERATPQNFRVPQTAPIVQTPRQAEAATKMDAGGSAPRVPEPDFWDRLGAFSRGYNTGGLVGAIADGFGSGLDRQVAAQNQTAQALVKMGVAPELASIAIRNPDVMKAILAQSIGGATPEIKEIEEKDEYGQTSKTPVIYNRSTRQWERLKLGGGAPAPSAPASPAAPSAPASMPTAPQAPGAPSGPGQFILPGDLKTQNIGEVGASGIPGRPQPQGAGMGEVTPPDSQPGPAAPKERIGEGYMQKSDDQGRPLWRRINGRLEPVTEPRAAAEARGRTQEQLAVKRGEAKIETEATTSGMKNVVSTARNIINEPGFAQGLALKRAETGWQVAGQDVDPSQLGYTAARVQDPNNPVWQAYDQITTIQNRLNLIAGRAFLKNQGQVSNFERQMVSKAIGDLMKASGPADFLFRLNSVNKMIEDLNVGKMQDEASYNARPTGQELKDIYETPDQTEINSKVEALAVKYDVPRDAMSQYVIEQFNYTKAGRAAPAPAPRGIPNQPPPGARDLPPNSGYPPGSKATRNPNNPNEWIVWTPD